MDKKTIISINNISKSFGGVKAVDDVSFSVKQNEIKALIGPNGAGKTTLFNIITKLYTKDSGKIIFLDEDMEKYKSYNFAKMGISRTFQNIQLVDDLTVLENIALGYHSKMSVNLFDAFIHNRKNKRQEERANEKSLEILKFLKIEHMADKYPNEIPFGHKRLVEISRALVNDPVLLMLDEPAAGLNESETNRLLKTIFRIWEKGVTIFLIEHDMNLVMNCSHSIVVMDSGKKIAEGTPSYIQNNDNVIKAYFGE